LKDVIFLSFDGSFTHSMAIELNTQLQSARVSKISQPYPNEVVLTFRNNRKNLPLLLSANPTYARAQISEIPYANPEKPTNFTMMLRKYLGGAVLQSVSQLENDRVLNFAFSSRNELGDTIQLSLIIEIMARHSNVILIDQSTMTVLDAIKHVGSDQNRYRTLLPGSTYINPPAQNLRNPFEFDTHDLIELLKAFPNEDVLGAELQKRYQGLGKDTASALAKQLHQPGDSTDLFKEFFDQFNNPIPTLSLLANNKTMFSAFPYVESESNNSFDSLSKLLDFYFQDRVERDRVQQQGSTLIHVVRNELKKNKNKVKKLKRTLVETESADEFRVKGEILTTYLNKVTRGMKEITLPNFYEEEKPLKISLSNQISPSQNAQKYFKKYNKLQNAVTFVNEQLKETNEEIDYLESVMSQIELAKPSDLVEIRLELQEGGYLRNHEHDNKKKQKKHKIAKPDQFTASDGTSIEVGKNNLQNDQLTLKTAKKTDIWLHVKNIPGSHVIIHDPAPSEETLMEAANLAAYFSKGRQSSTVPVDYIQVKKIRKPNGAKPGFVVYEGQKTVFVTPDEALVSKLETN